MSQAGSLTPIASILGQLWPYDPLFAAAARVFAAQNSVFRSDRNTNCPPPCGRAAPSILRRQLSTIKPWRGSQDDILRYMIEIENPLLGI
jgi:hypothetical protein